MTPISDTTAKETELVSGPFRRAPLPRLIQAGMGIRVSGWRLAHETSRLGALGVVSHVALRHVVVEEVRAGDETAIAAALRFPFRDYVDELMAYAPGGTHHRAAVPMDSPDPRKGRLAQRLSVIAAFVEVTRAKSGHHGQVGINVMWKCALTVLPSIYGAMLAGVDALLCGAGVPMELPDIVRRFRAGEDIEYAALHGTGTPVALAVSGDNPAEVLARWEAPRLIPILSNFAFPKRIVDIWEREQGGARPDAFVLENHAAGGHNAPPRDKTAFGPADDIDSYFDKVVALGVPVFVAGAFPQGGNADDLAYWSEHGAYGLQVGSRFALSDESGMRRDIKDALLEGSSAEVRTDSRISPTGYPFKLAAQEGTVSDPTVFAKRKRRCDKGYLLRAHTRIRANGTEELTYICPAMPLRQYQMLGGDLADTEGRACLCNGLLSTVGFGADKEPPLITLGVSGAGLRERHTAREVVEDILGRETVAAAERELLCRKDPEFASNSFQDRPQSAV